MKKFLIKISIFLILYLLLGRVIELFIPYSWGNPWFTSKLQYLQTLEKKDFPNTYFFGSSRVYRQIDPDIFDSTLNRKNYPKIKSFNLGAPATFCPQTYYLYENFLKSDFSENTSYAMLELMPIDHIAKEIKHQERTTYWLNINDMYFVLKAIFNTPFKNIRSRLKGIGNYMLSYLEMLLHAGHFGQQIIKDDYYKENFIGIKKNGFYSIEDQLISSDDNLIKDHLIERKEKLLEDSLELTERAEVSRSCFNNITDKYNEVHLQKLKDLIALSNRKNIHLMFILSPRNSSQEIVNLFNCLPENNKIDLSNADKYPGFYLMKNSFDIGHLNKKGAKLYTSTLAREFIKIN